MTCKAIVVALLVLLTGMPRVGWAQVPSAAEAWRTFAAALDVGTQVVVRLDTGRRFTATLVEARQDVLLIQPKTRVPVPIQSVPYDAVVSLERRRERGMSAGKAVAIGAAAGAGVVFTILGILLASID